MFEQVFIRSCVGFLLGLTLLVLTTSATPAQRRGICMSVCGEFIGVRCPSGYTCRSNGCGHECFNSTFIQPPGCSPFICDVHCSLGYTRDDQGCQYCECDYSALETPAAGK